MKKIIYSIVTILELAFLAGAYIVNYFTVKKLGMNRWVNARCLKWEKMYPIFGIKVVVILLLLALTVLVVRLYWKKRKEVKRRVGFMTVMTIVLSFVCIGFVLFKSFAVMRAYYFISMMFAVAAFLQIIKTLVAMKVCRNEK